MHQALFGTSGALSTVACALPFKGTVGYALTDAASSNYTGPCAIAWTDLPNTFDVNWDGRDTHEANCIPRTAVG